MPFANRDGVRLFWRADGHPDRPALLLLNSLGCDHAMWDGVVHALSGRFRLLRMDTRGHGASDAPPGDYSIADLAADAFAVLDAAGAPVAAVAGVSMGGMTAMQMAVSAPGRLSAIAVCNSTAAISPPQPWLDRAAAARGQGMASLTDAVLARWFPAAVRAANPAYLATVRAMFETLDPQGYAACCIAISRLDVADKLGGITLPTLVLVGSLDEATPPATGGEPIAAAIRGARSPACRPATSRRWNGRTHWRRCWRSSWSRCSSRRAMRSTRGARRCSTPASPIAAPCWGTPTWTARWPSRAASPGSSTDEILAELRRA